MPPLQIALSWCTQKATSLLLPQHFTFLPHIVVADAKRSKCPSGRFIPRCDSLQLREASEHGFADCVFVRVRGREGVVGAFSTKSGSFSSQLGLKRKTAKRHNSTEY